MVETQKVVKNFPWSPHYDNRTYTNSEGETVRAYEDGARHVYHRYGNDG